MLHEVEDTSRHIAKLTAAVFAVNQLPDIVGIGTDTNLITRSLKKGFLLYGVNEAVEWATVGHSNFNKMDTMQGWKNLVDDSVFFGATSAADDTFGITQAITNAIPPNPLPPLLINSAVVAGFLYGTKVLGSKVENSVIKHVSDLFM